MVSPRPYRLGKRQDPVDQGRLQVLDAARRLLGGTVSYAGFTVDAVARQADVARATVYYQFGTKAGLLEAVCDHLAGMAGLAGPDGLAAAFTEPDPDLALSLLMTAFGRLWAADRDAMRRLRALARLDPEVGTVIAARDQRRHDALTAAAGRLAPQEPDPAGLVRLLMALTSFETFDVVAGPDGDLAAAVPGLVRLAQTALNPAARSGVPKPAAEPVPAPD